MTVVWVVAYTLLSGGAALSMVRVWRGPSLLDRVVATETLLAIIAGGIAVYAGLARDPAVVPVLLVVALLGFLGAVSVARYVGGMLIKSGTDDGRAAGLPPAAEQTVEGR
ncbi:monovalent cation/H+ antiporter complex subunit F [Blastococcus xanthinilyticus]|uniref:Multisubunit sodium/proton antiporter MrpF subunit n=1 Tax=Blastococcus xanthinilyticus TaxID=1564164 RepID=A0A5S5CTH8_9ACTN|nr:monovalent cation/H+ antiporter complex subunit F [Blastococcus xanthinilyticus]TYP87101.1 multisubunit sodium/proton antiporter MrpF subunit [Blastococcus xanthinilyticus]